MPTWDDRATPRNGRHGHAWPRPSGRRQKADGIRVTALQRDPLMTEDAAFNLSRIYAKGWTAGGDSSIVDSDDGLDATIATLNPYRTDAERERWALGFQAARRRAEEMAVRSKAPRRKSGPA